jgi:hypothetical protein
MIRSVFTLITGFVLALCITARAVDPSVTLTNAEGRNGKPGEYITLAFPASGSGEVRFELTPPEGWDALSTSRTVTLEGERLVIFNLRVPLEALADTTVRFTLRAFIGTQVRAESTGEVRVLTVSGVRMRAPDEVRFRVGDPVRFQAFVTNTGNRADTVRLTPVRTIWPVTLEPTSLALAVGETRPVTVTVSPQGVVTDGYFFLLRLRGESSIDDQSDVDIQTIVRFGAALEAREANNPQLTLNLGLNAGVALTLPPALEPDVNVSFSVLPSLAGQLSDVATGTLDAGAQGVGYSSKSGFNVPSGLALGVRGAIWDSSFRISSSELTWSANLALQDWRLSGMLYAGWTGDSAVRVNLNALNNNPGLPLEFYLGASGRGGANPGRDDALGVNYRFALSSEIALTTGLALTGSSGSAFSDYSFGLALDESLRWQSPAFELLQTFGAIPLSNRYSLSLYGALRQTTPFGLRASSNVDMTVNDPIQFTWRNSVTAFAQVFTGFSVSATAGYSMQTTPNYLITYNLGGSANYGVRILGVGFAGVNANVSHVGIINGDAPTLDRVGLDATLNLGNFTAGAEASFAVTSSTLLNPGVEATRVGARLTYAFSSNTALGALYSYALDVSATNLEKHELGAFWTQVWNADIATSVQFSRIVTGDLQGTFQRGDALNVALGVQNFIADGVSLNLGWRWSSADGSIFDPSSLSAHTFTLGIGYNLALTFDTPRFVVDLTGGRLSGALQGVAYRDLNLNGLRDPDEPVISGLTVKLGDSTTVTDSQGRYTLRAPVGRYTLDFPQGLEGGVSLLGPEEVQVQLNETETRDLGFAPTTTLDVTLFDDTNNNGVRDTTEPGIPYGGVRVVGPVTKLVRVDGNGNATVSGLVDGVYSVVPDPQQLPADYRATTQAVAVTVRTPDSPPAVSVGAGLPPRSVETTFESGNLAVFASLPNGNSLPAGAETTIEALTQGDVTRVTATLGERTLELTKLEDRWSLRTQVPFGTEPGSQTVTVTAYSASAQTSFELGLEVTDDPPFRAPTYRATTAQEIPVELTTLYRATGPLVVRFEDGSSLTLTSTDGYTWRGTWRAPATAARLGAVLFDGEQRLGALTFVASAPATLLRAPLLPWTMLTVGRRAAATNVQTSSDGAAVCKAVP